MRAGCRVVVEEVSCCGIVAVRRVHPTAVTVTLRVRDFGVIEMRFSSAGGLGSPRGQTCRGLNCESLETIARQPKRNPLRNVSGLTPGVTSSDDSARVDHLGAYTNREWSTAGTVVGVTAAAEIAIPPNLKVESAHFHGVLPSAEMCRVITIVHCSPF